MTINEKIKLLYRAFKYRFHDDPAEINYLLHHIKKGATVFDIGAHKGGYTYWMRKATGNTGKVITFEPQQKGAQLLQQLYANSNVIVEQKAVSNKNGTTKFYVQPQTFDVSFEASIVNKYEHADEVQVDTTTIDHYCHHHSLKPSFIKIDVEGFEKEVLEGATDTLAHIHPVLLIEIEERHIGKEKMQEIFRFLQSFNYTGRFFHQKKLLPLKDFDATVHQSMQALESNKYLYSNNFLFQYMGDAQT